MNKTDEFKNAKIKNNRTNGKKYEGELTRVLKEDGLSARLGRSNEEGDVVITDLDIVIEAKSTNNPGKYKMSKSPGQFFRLKKIPQKVFFGIRFKGEGLAGWRFFPLPNSIQVLNKDQGLNLREFILLISGGKFDHSEHPKGKNEELQSLGKKVPLVAKIVPSKEVSHGSD